MLRMFHAGIFVMLVFILLGAAPAYAYVDPGSGSAIVTAVLGFFAAIGYTMRKQFYKVRKLFKSKPDE